MSSGGGLVERRGRLEDKVVLITGAAQGIGAAVTRRMAEEGAHLWLNDVSETLTELVAELEASGVRVHGEVGDASDPGLIEAWVAAAISEWGRVDVLYNNVGISRHGLIGDLSDTDWRDQQRLTLDTVFYATRAVLPHLISGGGGSIVSMSSGAGIGGNYGLGGYAAAKAGVINLMETVAMEYGPLGIRANSVTPGPTATAPLLAYVEQQPGDLAGLTRGLDLRRLTQPSEVAEIVLWLASDESSSVTGTCIRSNIRAASTRPD
jgi:NAD(P)-dependent dehydrogenase (short-subunit alcohol dehydrogenase family)